MPDIKPGDRMLLETDNPLLDGLTVTVKERTHYGAVVFTGVGSGEYRALAEELGSLRQRRPPLATGDVCDMCGGSNMIRAGACLVCADCGTSGGCS